MAGEFKIQGGITWGTVTQLVGTAMMLAAGWQALAGDVASNRKWIEQTGEPGIARLQSDMAADRLNTNTILTNVQADVRYMRERLDEMRQSEARQTRSQS